MKPKQRFLNGIDIALIVGVVVFSLAGLAYAVFSGVLSLPGVKPFLPADTKPSPSVAKKAAVSSPQPNASPSIADSPDPHAEMKARDATRKENLATIQTYLRDYSAKYKKFPLTNSGVDSEKIEVALKVLIDTGTASALPVDPSADRFYMYVSDGKTYSLTAQLEDTSDPSGANNTETPPKYLYSVKNP